MIRFGRLVTVVTSSVGVAGAVGLSVLAAEVECIGNGGLSVACVIGAVGLAEVSGWVLAWLTK